MTVYLVISRDCDTEEIDDNFYGVFTKKEKAEKVREDLQRNFNEHDKKPSIVEIISFTLDEKTSDYHWFMNNY